MAEVNEITATSQDLKGEPGASIFDEMLGRLDYSRNMTDPRKEWAWLDNFPSAPQRQTVPEGYSFNLLGDTRRHLLKALGFNGAGLDCIQDVLESMTRAASRKSGPLAGKTTRTIDRSKFLALHGHSESTFKRTIAHARAIGMLNYRNVTGGKGKGSRTHYWLTDQCHKFFHVWVLVTDDLPKNVRRSGRLFEALQREILLDKQYIRTLLDELVREDVSTVRHWIIRNLVSTGWDYRAGQTVNDIIAWVSHGNQTSSCDRSK